jgi:hypothetical protein
MVHSLCQRVIICSLLPRGLKGPSSWLTHRMTCLDISKIDKNVRIDTAWSTSIGPMLCLPASAECCGSELGLIECESLTSLPSQVETPKHNLKCSSCSQLHLQGTTPTYLVRWLVGPLTGPKQPGSWDPHLSGVAFGRPNNWHFQGLTQ